MIFATRNLTSTKLTYEQAPFHKKAKIWTLSPTNSVNISTQTLNKVWNFQNRAIASNFKQQRVANKVYCAKADMPESAYV